MEDQDKDQNQNTPSSVLPIPDEKTEWGIIKQAPIDLLVLAFKSGFDWWGNFFFARHLGADVQYGIDWCTAKSLDCQDTFPYSGEEQFGVYLKNIGDGEKKIVNSFTSFNGTAGGNERDGAIGQKLCLFDGFDLANEDFFAREIKYFVIVEYYLLVGERVDV